MTLIDMQGLRKLLVEHYENLDAETRALVPLKRLYWPLA
jgi:restriction system protein